MHAARNACTQSPDSLMWVFLYQPLSNLSKDKAHHRRWVLAPLTRTPNSRAEWIGTYQSTSPNATNIAMFRPNMAGRPFPTLVPMADQRYSFRFTAPLTAVWFRATQPTTQLCCPPPYMDPVSFIIETMRRAKEARLCAPPRLWKDLPGYHQIGEGMMNPKAGSSLDVITTFSQFDNEPFPCMKTDQEYCGLGSTFAVLERAAAIDHALRSDPFPGLSNCDTMDFPCMTNGGDPTSPCSMCPSRDPYHTYGLGLRQTSPSLNTTAGLPMIQRHGSPNTFDQRSHTHAPAERALRLWYASNGM